MNFKFNIKRDFYNCRSCGFGFAPIDEVFSFFEEHSVTKGMADEIAYSAQNSVSFEKGSANIKRYKNIDISESLVRTISERIGQIVYDMDVKQAEKSYEKPEKVPYLLEKEKKKGILYIYADGSMINTVVKGENGSSWHEIKLGLVYNDQNSITRKDGKKIITEKEYVAHFGGVEVFKKLLFDSVIRSGYGQIEKVVFLGDGAIWIWNMCDELYPDAIQILDHSHLKENVYKFARYLYPNNEQKITVWAESIMFKIDSGKINEVINELPTIESKLPAGIPNIKKYIINNKERINYTEFKDKGYNIGSGAVESGHKGVLQQRLKQPGMRWDMTGGQYIATLRTKAASNAWNIVSECIAA